MRTRLQTTTQASELPNRAALTGSRLRRAMLLCGRQILPGGLLSALLAVSPAALARPGDLDPTFGDNGRVFVDIPNDIDIAATVVQQHDGKLVVGRLNRAADDDFSVLRFDSDGSPDASFDGDGRTSLDVSGIKGTTHVVLQQADGKIVAAGTASASADSPSRNFGLARYNDDGSLDTTFGAGGVVIHDLGGWDGIFAIVQQADGRLVAAGETDGGASATPDMAFVRFNADGSLDRSFGENGAVIINFHESNGDDRVQWLVQQNDGALIATGSATPSNSFSHNDMPIVRLLPDGQPDPTLDGDGRVTIELSDPSGQGAGNLAWAASIASEADGRIVVVGNGNRNIWDYGSDTPLIARVNNDGRPDTTFGDGGTAWIDLYGAYLQGVIAEANGPIDLAGDYLNDHFVARLAWDGGLDASFGVGGVAIIDAGDGNTDFNDGWASLIRQSDGKIVTASSTTWSNPWDYGLLDTPTQIVIARLLVGDEGGHPGLLGFYRPISSVEGEVVHVPVRRTGGSSGDITVDYDTLSDSATSGEDFTAASGTLTWGDGDVADKIIDISIAADSTNESSETFRVALSRPSGGAILASETVLVEIEGSSAAPPPVPPPPPGASGSGDGGGGGLDWLSLACLVGLLPMFRRRASGRSDGFERCVQLLAKRVQVLSRNSAAKLACVIGRRRVNKELEKLSSSTSRLPCSCPLGTQARPQRALLAGFLFAQVLAGCDSGGGDPPTAPLPDPPPPTPVAAEIEHGHYRGVSTIDGQSYHAEAVLTVEGEFRLYVGGLAYSEPMMRSAGFIGHVFNPEESMQFSGHLALDGREGSGTGVVVGEDRKSVV